MGIRLKGAAVYIRSNIHQAIKLKSTVTQSEHIRDRQRCVDFATLSEDEEDLRAVDERADEISRQVESGWQNIGSSSTCWKDLD